MHPVLHEVEREEKLGDLAFWPDSALSSLDVYPIHHRSSALIQAKNPASVVAGLTLRYPHSMYTRYTIVRLP